MPSFILNYILIRVKERGFGIRKRKEQKKKRRESIERETIEKGKHKALEKNLLA